MRLSKIKLAGFKSFVDPTTLTLPSNLVGVVGPNGCGKSNVIDAVRWVMGESSAKHLRGDSMADVIFNGSSSRKPVGHASVELVFDNADGTIGGEYAKFSEISIRRQVSRDGQSTYYLNGARCRRRDITDIFLGTGLGPRSYSIIEQGMISRLIEAKPEELRVYLEEAAGISKYKERRRETENRIRHTRENLERLNDLREEVDKQLQHLKRQARTAERYKELKQEERRLKAELLALRLQALDTEAEAQERVIREHETALEAAVARQRAIEAELERQRASHVEATDAFNEVQARFYGIGSDISRLEQAIQHGKDMRHKQQEDLRQIMRSRAELDSHIDADRQRVSELEARLAEAEPSLAQLSERREQAATQLQEAETAMQDWQQRWEAFNNRSAESSESAQVERTRIDHLERHIIQLQQRLDKLDEEDRSLVVETLEREAADHGGQADELASRVAELQSLLDATRDEIEQQRETRQRIEHELGERRGRMQDLRGRLASLHALQQAALGQGDGAVSEWLARQGLGDATRLAQRLEVDSGWEHALETVLGTHLEAVCVDGLDPLAEILDSLQEGGLTLFDTRQQGSRDPAGQGHMLLDHVRAPWPLDSLLGGIHVAHSLGEALALRDRLGVRESVITADGIWMGKGWLRVARDNDEHAGVLAREKEIKQLEQALESLAADTERLQAQLDESREAERALEIRREELQQEINQAHRRQSELSARASNIHVRIEQVRERKQAIARERDELGAQIEQDTAEARQARTRLETLVAQMAGIEQEREGLMAERDRLQSALEQARKQAREASEQAHGMALEVQTMRSQLEATRQGLARMESQLDELSQRQQVLEEVLENSQAPISAQEQELAALLEQRVTVEAELGEARKRLEDIDERVRTLEQQRSEAEQDVQSVRADQEQSRIAFQEIRVRRQTLREQLDETGFSQQELLEQIEADASIDMWQERVEKMAARIQRLGPINLAAIDEFAEQSERKVYLDSQFEDVTEALTTLENAIRKIDRETRTRFKETFDKVNAGLKAMFPRMFGGGHAYLELTGDDLLDAGVTVMARPPGKRNSSIHLLSGGEKALTAVSLVFSIFQLNPAPFCMLDEVDAPLDDANVGRFCDMVREMSENVQFIFITHNKITMSIANQLSGVTMHEPGVSRLVAVDVEEAAKMVAV